MSNISNLETNETISSINFGSNHGTCECGLIVCQIYDVNGLFVQLKLELPSDSKQSNTLVFANLRHLNEFDNVVLWRECGEILNDCKLYSVKIYDPLHCCVYVFRNDDVTNVKKDKVKLKLTKKEIKSLYESNSAISNENFVVPKKATLVESGRGYRPQRTTNRPGPVQQYPQQGYPPDGQQYGQNPNQNAQQFGQQYDQNPNQNPQQFGQNVQQVFYRPQTGYPQGQQQYGYGSPNPYFGQQNRLYGFPRQPESYLYPYGRQRLPYQYQKPGYTPHQYAHQQYSVTSPYQSPYGMTPPGGYQPYRPVVVYPTQKAVIYPAYVSSWSWSWS